MTVTAAPSSPAVTQPPTAMQRATALVDAMSVAERAGAIVMTAGTADELPGLKSLIAKDHLGGVMVRGRSDAGTAAVAAAVHAAVGSVSPRPLVATDQEGGEVQVLSGPGFSDIPSAVVQGEGSPTDLESDAQRWGDELRAAGVDLDLAPVGDVPCPAHADDDPPIAGFDRQFSDDPASAAASLGAFVTGMTAAGVATTVKHFPGLGCVGANTDTTAHVVDDSTTLDSAALAPYAAGIEQGTPAVMVSSAIYSRIDPTEPALFSKTIIGALSSRYGFDGVVVSDDVGSAVALAQYSPATRATRFVAAGGDLLLDVDPDHADAETAALAALAKSDPAFADRLKDAAVHDLALRLSLDPD